MTTIKDLAKILVSQHKLRTEDAEAFISQITEVINEGLINDRQVKIKGFGTFKLQTVKERSSINVNTGERVIIGEHDKVTFTPDSVMRDLVNKPFSQFDTVIINDETLIEEELNDSENMEEESSETVEAEDNLVESGNKMAGLMEAASEESDGNVDDVNLVASEIKEEIVTDENTETEETVKEEIDTEDNNEEEKEVESAVQQEVEKVEEEEEEDDDDDDDDEYDEEHSPMYYYSIGGIICGILFFIIGYFAGMNGWFKQWIGPKEQPQTEVVDSVSKSQNAEPMASDSINKPSESNNGNDVQEKKNEQASDIIDNEEYSKKDVRVRTGAWAIVGTETEVTVREGQTLKSISKAYLGPDMECYVEVYNDKKTVKAGDVIKIPKLKPKKQIRK